MWLLLIFKQASTKCLFKFCSFSTSWHYSAKSFSSPAHSRMLKSTEQLCIVEQGHNIQMFRDTDLVKRQGRVTFDNEAMTSFVILVLIT